MEALLAGVPGCITLGDATCAPFRVTRSGLILLPPALIINSSAAAAAARWGAEALHARQAGELNERRVVALLRHGANLLEFCTPAAHAIFEQLLPSEITMELKAGTCISPSQRLRSWLPKLIEGASLPRRSGDEFPPLEFELPLEVLLIAGGDSRLALDPVTQLNRYGVCPRPRPEAVHFSSSTASAISRHGFLYTDLLRRHLLDLALEAKSVAPLRRRAIDATAREIEALLSLKEGESDVVITPSGTDAEMVSVMLSLAATENRPLTNLLISPEESGKGVLLAGSGKFFDNTAASGTAVRKGAEAFPGRAIQIEEVAVRNEDCRARPPAEVDAEILAKGRAALDRGHHLLVHVLLGSKTGLSAPGWEVVEQLVRGAPERVDVAVDACQMRSSWTEMGDMVRRGWMVQISGSKFLTGPPFSGALLLPPSLRTRTEAVCRLLIEAPGVSLPGDWPLVWANKMQPSSQAGSFGTVFRWLPALMEGCLYASLTEEQKLDAFDRFRTSLVKRFMESPYIEAIDDDLSGSKQTDIGRLSIMAFQVLGKQGDGCLAPLNEKGCQWLFEQLNRDMSSMVPGLTPADQAAAQLCCHIGQPVILNGARQQLAFLRLVLGARFFNIVGHAEAGTAEAALESEIADAKRVLSKIEWIASQWWRFQPLIEAQ